jgi:hypothetical protein
MLQNGILGKERSVKEVRSLKIIKLQDTLWGGGLNGKEFVERYARRHKLQVVVVDNHCVYYEIGQKSRVEESKCSDFESSNVDVFYSLYHSKLILKDKTEKLQSRQILTSEGSLKCLRKKNEHTMNMN